MGVSEPRSGSGASRSKGPRGSPEEAEERHCFYDRIGGRNQKHHGKFYNFDPKVPKHWKIAPIAPKCAVFTIGLTGWYIGT